MLEASRRELVPCPTAQLGLLSGAGMKGQEAQEVLFSHPNLWAGPQSSALASLGPSLDQAGLPDCTACPGVYKQSQGKGWGCMWGGEQLFLPWLQPPSSSPPFYRGGNGKLGWQGRRPHANQRRDSREKKHQKLGT